MQIDRKGRENGSALGVDIMDFLFPDKNRILYTGEFTEQQQKQQSNQNICPQITCSHL